MVNGKMVCNYTYSKALKALHSTLDWILSTNLIRWSELHESITLDHNYHMSGVRYPTVSSELATCLLKYNSALFVTSCMCAWIKSIAKSSPITVTISQLIQATFQINSFELADTVCSIKTTTKTAVSRRPNITAWVGFKCTNWAAACDAQKKATAKGLPEFRS